MLRRGLFVVLSSDHTLESGGLIEQHIYVASAEIDVGGRERGTLYKWQTNMSMLTIQLSFYE